MVRLLICVMIILFSARAYCSEGELIIEGSILKLNSDKGYIITTEEFDMLPKGAIITTTPWTPKGKRVEFKGVYLSYILKLTGAKGSKLKFHALNDYEIIVDVNDVVKYNILLATEADGKRLQLRDFGPFFLIYPLDQHYIELNTPHYLARFIWQVDKITVMK